MKLKDCVNMMKHKSKKFALLNQLTPTTKLSIAKDHNLIIIKDNEIEFMEGLLLGTFSTKKHFLELPYYNDNELTTTKNNETYLKLKKFGINNNIPELSEPNIFFTSSNTTTEQIQNRIKKENLKRNEDGILVSLYTLDEILAISAIFYKCRAIVPLNFNDYIIYVGIPE